MSTTIKPVTQLLLSDNNIFTLTLDTNEKRYLTHDGSPSNQYLLASWSPDGSRIVYTNLQATGPYIWIMNADGSDQKQLTTDHINGMAPSFSPDGQSILFSGYGTGNPELWLMNVDGTNPRPITLTIGSAVVRDGLEVTWSTLGSFSPDGTKIAYSSTESGRPEIWVMNSDGSARKQLTFPDDPNAPDANNPTWSPDGDKIVFFGGFARIGGYIFTINQDGSDRRQLTFIPSDDPSWSPDGKQIFFDIAPISGQRPEAWIMDRDGGNQRPLSSSPVLPSRVPAITKWEAVTSPDDAGTAQPTGFDLQDITSPGPAFDNMAAAPVDETSVHGLAGDITSYSASASSLDYATRVHDNGDSGSGGGDGGCGGCG